MSKGRPDFSEVLMDLGRLIEALGDYRQVAVLTGGLVPFFFRRLPEFAAPAIPPLFTSDMDWTLPRELKVRGEQPLADRLADSHFVVIRTPASDPPVQWFQHERHGRDRLAPIYAEFLVPLVGSASSRAGRARTVRVVQRGLTAQALRYLDLLLHSPIKTDASLVRELGLVHRREILLPQPANYVLQKILAWPERAPEKRDKDLAYVYEVALLTRDRLDDVARSVAALRRRHPAPWFARARKLMEKLFASDTSDGPIAVARQYRGLMTKGGAPSERAVWTVVHGFTEAWWTDAGRGR